MEGDFLWIPRILELKGTLNEMCADFHLVQRFHPQSPAYLMVQ